MPESGQNDAFLTVAEVADLLKLNQQTVRNWIDAGTLPAFRVGRRVRILRADLEQILTDGRQGNGETTWSTSSGGPSARDFWGGEPIGAAEVDPDFHRTGGQGPARPT